MQFHASDEHGGQIIVRVADVDEDGVTVDANHPLAGQTLHFTVEVLDVRAATAEELAHGHVHGAGGHQH
jgi:FKBP-type peptidyl-prolyl cis-trans isomerase SlyD